MVWLIFFGFGQGRWIPNNYLVFFSFIFGLFPDFDGIYYLIKKRGEGGIDTEFQHHLYYWTHWPISYIPVIILFIFSLIFNFYPEYFLMPVVGIYGGHLFFDSISCGDGIMWGKIPWKKEQYGRYINLMPDGSDGYHGVYWEARYRKTIISKIGNIAVLISVVILILFQISQIIESIPLGQFMAINGYYITPIIFFIIAFYIGAKKPKPEHLKEPPEGRYADYRLNPTYINGLKEKNRKKHIENYADLLAQKGIMDKIN